MRRALFALILLWPLSASAQVTPFPFGATPPIVGLPAFNASAPITPTSAGFPATTCAAPGIYLTTATTTGIAFTATPSVILCVNGSAIVTASATAVTSTVPVNLPNNTFFGGLSNGAVLLNLIGVNASNRVSIDSGANGALFGSFILFNDNAATLGWSDVSLSRGAANRLDLATGDSFNVVSGSYMAGGVAGVSGTCSSVTVVNGIVTACVP